MKLETTQNLKDGDHCKVIGGVHISKLGMVRDNHTSKTGHITIKVVQNNRVRFKTSGKNVLVIPNKIKA